MDPSTPEFVLKSRRVVLPEGLRPAALLIHAGRIAAILPYDKIPLSCRIEDVGNSVILPGLVDSHVHINEPGRTDWEGFETATQSAALGGITTLVDMPLNSDPVTTALPAFKTKIAATKGKLWVDVGFWGGLVHGNASKMSELVVGGVLGIKAFMVHSGIDDFTAATEEDMAAALPSLKALNTPLLVHAELDRKPAPKPAGANYAAYVASRPPAWELDAIDMLIRLCETTKAHVHIVHLATAEALPRLAAARKKGLPLTVETCPHYIYFSADKIPDGATQYKCAPPIRDDANRRRLIDGLKSGVIDLIASDHSPCPPSMKQLDTGNFGAAWGGIASLQVSLAAAWTALRPAGATPADIARWMSSAPAKLAGLTSSRGAIAEGLAADLVVWNPEASTVVRPETLYHRHKVTPYAGQTLYGVVERTYLKGVVVAEQGMVRTGAGGSPVLREVI